MKIEEAKFNIPYTRNVKSWENKCFIIKTSILVPRALSPSFYNYKNDGLTLSFDSNNMSFSSEDLLANDYICIYDI